MKYVIGVDLGTSATKTILVDQNGKIVAEASVKYPMYQPENGWAEQDPSDWSEAAISTIKSVVEKGQVNGKDVRGIGISGQMHGLVMLNEENQVIRRSIIWCDQRATKQDVYEKLPLDAALDAAYINFMTVIDEHLEFIRMMVRENGVREFLSEEEVRSIWKNRIPWLPTLLKRKMEAGEVKEMDFEMAALSVNSILMHYVMKRVTDTGHSTLDDKAWRKRLVDYQVSVWSVEKQPENEKEQE